MYMDKENKRIIHANELVSLLKQFPRDIEEKLKDKTEIDFVGASECYIREKANYCIDYLQWFKKMIRNTEQKQKLKLKNK